MMRHPIRQIQAVVLAVLVLGAAIAHADRAVRMTRELAFSEQRVALVIGNANYKSSPLKNPVNDAKDVSARLEKLGFSVSLLLDANQRTMRKAIREFGSNLKKGGVGLFYYAGHGMQVQGRNFLIPVGADIREEDEVQDYAVDAGMVLRKMQSAENRLNIVLLDACRNNPFARSFRSAGRGLAQMDAPAGSMISYATAPGRTAMDGDGRNGIFTKNFLEALDTYGHLELSQLMKQVGRGVQTETQKMQVPWVSSSITGDFFFSLIPPDKQVKNTSLDRVASTVKSLDEEEEFWLAIKDSALVEDFKDYLALYPNGRFHKIAEIKLRHLSPAKKKPEPVKRASGDRRLLEERFTSNENNWTLWPDGEFYTTSIGGGAFYMETLNELNSAEFIGSKVDFPENYDIEVDSTWLKGVDDRAYGLTLGSEPQNRYNFAVSGNGWSMASGYKENKVLDPNPIPWASGTSRVGNGRTVNHLKLSVRSGTCTFYVNGKPVGSVFVPIPRSQLKPGFFVENKQRVMFDNLIVTCRDASGSRGFSDDFNDNSNGWALWPHGEYYITRLENGVYEMETKNTLNSVEFPGTLLGLSENVDIQAVTIWKKGVDNYSYGISVGTDPKNRYNFGVSGNGWSTVSAHQNNATVNPAPMPWTSGTSVIGNGWSRNTLRIRIRGTQCDYYVNGNKVGSVTMTMPHNLLRVGFFVENMQKVHFDDLAITEY